MKTYLVTGGAGFIGSNFIHYLLEKYNDQICIINIDKLTYAGNLENLRDVESLENYEFRKIDICAQKAVEDIFHEYDIDYVVHFAAESHVDHSILRPAVFVETNVLGTQVLLETAKRYWETNAGFLEGKKFLQVSTDEVYGSLGEDGYFVETTPLDPHSPYSASKAGADMLVKAYYDTYGMPVNISRCSNNYGPYQYPEKLIPLMIDRALRGMELPIYGDGKNIRDWLYVEDHCRALDLILQKGETGEIYNIGGHNEKQNIEIVKEIIQEMNKQLNDTDSRKNRISEDLIKFVEDRKGHDQRYGIDPSKILSHLGWKPRIRWKDGLVLTIQWYLKQQEWLEKLKEKQ